MLIVTRFCCMAIFLAVEVSDRPTGPAPNLLGASAGFEGSAPLPDSEVKPHFDRARTKMLEVNSQGKTLSTADLIASWASFLATASSAGEDSGIEGHAKLELDVGGSYLVGTFLFSGGRFLA